MIAPGIRPAERRLTSTDTSRRAAVTEIVRTLDDGFVTELRPELAPLVNWGGGAALPIHRWLRYREGFSPRLISELQLGDSIYDPFCGSGSIMVGAAQCGRSAIGADVNPLAAFAAWVKLSPMSPAEVEDAARFRQAIGGAVEGAEPYQRPGLKIAGKVFEPEIMLTLLKLRTLIENSAGSRAVRDFLLLAWIAILESVGSYFKEGNGIKYRNRKRLRNGYVLRPDGEWQRDRFGDDQASFVLDRFERQLDDMLADVEQWRTGSWAHQRILEGNSLETTALLDSATFDSVIFSPPYANRFDYFESQKVELWFGGFVDNYDDMQALRRRSVRSHLGAGLGAIARGTPELEELIDLIDPDSYAVRMRVPALLCGYFDDMRRILWQSRRVLKAGGACHVVVGNSAYGGVIVPTDSLIARLGIEAGFERARVVPVRHLTVAPQQRNELAGGESFMRESVVMLS